MICYFLEPVHHADHPSSDPLSSHLEEDQNVSGKIYEPSEEKKSVNDEESIMESPLDAVEEDTSVMVESASFLAQDDAPKKSYASIVSAQMNNFHSSISVGLLLEFNFIINCYFLG